MAKRRSRDQLRAIFASLRGFMRRPFAGTKKKPVVRKVPPQDLFRPTLQKPRGYGVLRRLGQTPLLKREEERVLLKALKSGSPRHQALAKKRLIESNQRLVASIARRFQGRGIAFEDLMSEGNVGLIKAAESFNPDRAARFSTHATNWIRQAIGRALESHESQIRLPANLVNLRNKIRYHQQRLYQKTGNEPTHEELAKATNSSVKHIRQALEIDPVPTSLSQKLRGLKSDSGGERPASLEDIIPDRSSRDVAAEIQKGLNVAKYGAYMDALLSPTERHVLTHSYGLGGVTPKKYAQIGRHLGLSRERVRQIHEEALKKLRTPDTKRLEAYVRKQGRST